MRIQLKISNWLGLVLLGFIGSIVIITIGSPSYFEWLWIVPLTYAILTFFCFSFEPELFNSSVAGIVFNSLMILRAVFLPVLLALSHYNVSFISNMPNAILLFEYEIIAEYLFFTLYSVKSNHFKDKKLRYINNNFSMEKYWIILILLFLIAGFCLFLAPMGIYYYRTIFGITDYEYTGFDSRRITSIYATNLFRRFGLVTFHYVMNVSRILIPSILLIYVTRFGNRVINLITLVTGIFVFNYLIVDDTIATSIFNTFIITVFYRKLTQKSTQGIIWYLFIVVLFVGLYYSIRSSFNTGDSFLGKANGFAQAYFGGLNNISAGLNMSVNDPFMKFKYASYEVLRGIPYASTVFRLDNTNISSLFNNVNHLVGQIVPTICSGKLYFGYIFAPIYPLLFILISSKESKGIETDTKPLRLLSRIVISIYSLMGISIYSPEITWASIICVGLAIRAISYLFETERVEMIAS